MSEPVHADVHDLASFGYKQELNRSLGSFSSFAAGFSYISILTGMFQTAALGFLFAGRALVGQRERLAEIRVVEPDIRSIDAIEGGFNRRVVNMAPAGRLIPGKTVIFLDSYGLVALPQIVSFFQDVTVMRLVDFDQARYTSLIADADRVWIFSVERALSFRLSFEIGKPSFLAYLRANLPAHQPSR